MLLTAWRHRDPRRRAIYIFWRCLVPQVAFLTLVIISVSVLQKSVSALYWLVAVIVILLLVGVINSWDLLVREHRKAN